MNIRTIEVAIVVVASDCNPTILNPDFLQRLEIVPADWAWKLSGPPITTPPYAVVNYGSGISVSVETNKFQVVDRLTSGQLDIEKLIHISNRYIEVLPHVRYMGVGHNFKMFSVVENSEFFLKDRFLKLGPWDSDLHRIQTSSYKFTYPLTDGGLTITLEGAKHIDTSADETKETSGVLVAGNYHRNCTSYPSDAKVINYIQCLAADLDDFKETISAILDT